MEHPDLSFYEIKTVESESRILLGNISIKNKNSHQIVGVFIFDKISEKSRIRKTF